MVRKIHFCGHDMETLEKMKVEEVIDLLPSRARRSIRRGVLARNRKFLNKVRLAKKNNSKKMIKTHCRDMVILPEMIGAVLGVYDGKQFVRVDVMHQMVGHFLGEFAPTRRKVQHSAPGVGATRSSMYVPLK